MITEISKSGDFFCFHSRNGKAPQLPQIFFRICFRNDHGHARATKAGHTYEKTLQSKRVSFAFAFVLQQRENPKSGVLNFFIARTCFCEDGMVVLKKFPCIFDLFSAFFPNIRGFDGDATVVSLVEKFLTWEMGQSSKSPKSAPESAREGALQTPGAPECLRGWCSCCLPLISYGPLWTASVSTLASTLLRSTRILESTLANTLGSTFGVFLFRPISEVRYWKSFRNPCP